MTAKKLIVLVVVLMATAGFARADIIDWECADDGDGAIDCTASFNTAPYVEPYELLIDGVQYWGPGHMEGTFTTNTPLDPIVLMYTSIENDTAFAWAGYQVNISMDNPFTLSNVVVDLPTDWTVSYTQPVLVGSQYVGVIDYSGGAPVAIGDSLEFGYKMAFSGKTIYNFCQEMIPIAVPEPATFALLAVAGLLSLTFRRRS